MTLPDYDESFEVKGLMDDVLVKVLTDLFERNSDEVELEQIEQFVDAGHVGIDRFELWGNSIFADLDFIWHDDDHYSVMSQVVWDDDREGWFTFFDGSGPNDAYAKPDESGKNYKIVWMD